MATARTIIKTPATAAMATTWSVKIFPVEGLRPVFQKLCSTGVSDGGARSTFVSSPTNDVLALTSSSSDMSTMSSTNGLSETDDSSSVSFESSEVASTGAEVGEKVVGALVGLDETGAKVGDRLGEAVGADVIGASVGAGVFRGVSPADAESTLPSPSLG